MSHMHILHVMQVIVMIPKWFVPRWHRKRRKHILKCWEKNTFWLNNKWNHEKNMIPLLNDKTFWETWIRSRWQRDEVTVSCYAKHDSFGIKAFVCGRPIQSMGRIYIYLGEARRHAEHICTHAHGCHRLWTNMIPWSKTIITALIASQDSADF